MTKPLKTYYDGNFSKVYIDEDYLAVFETESQEGDIYKFYFPKLHLAMSFASKYASYFAHTNNFWNKRMEPLYTKDIVSMLINRGGLAQRVNVFM